jgi:hypothetical protein
LPSDFAPSEAAEPEPSGEINVDFQGATFVFTGKLKTMTRAQAQGKVKDANGKKGSGVAKTLDYLVIGDEGSAFYGAGRKGSKQLKAESLIEAGAALKVISETAFLQMLEGTRQEVTEEGQTAGCEVLWVHLTARGRDDDPLRLFAIAYIRHHHQDICPILTDRPVDPGAEIPHEFLRFERLQPLLVETRPHLLAMSVSARQRVTRPTRRRTFR